ncbi:MAG: sodium/proline symporter [Verrucomicrobia bacterium]|nr:sodium/proline symporter [Verrucomicrobiota bacterium]
MTFEISLAFALYFACLLIIGFLTYRRSKNGGEFVLGGRSLNFYVTALSAHASDMSSWLFMAYPASIFLFGGVQIWTAIGLLLGMFLNWQLVAPRLRRETERYAAVTLGTFFTNRFEDPHGTLRALSAPLALLFFTVYVSAGLVGMGYLFDVVLGIHPDLGMAVAMLVVIIYVTVGGFVSICWIDFFQALFLLAVIIMVPLVALMHEGGFSAIANGSSLRSLSWSLWPEQGNALVQVFLITFGWGLGYFGQTHILTKFMGIRDPAELVKSKWLGMSWQTLSLAAATLVGAAAVAYFPSSPSNPELVFVLMVKSLFHPFLAGIVLCAILAATISTIDSQIIVLVSVLAEDLYHRVLRKKAPPKEQLWASRSAVLLISVIAYLIAVLSGSTVMELVFYSWSGLGSTFGPVLLLALYDKKTNRAGAIFGMVYGGLVAALWPLVPTPITIPALIPGFLLNLPLIALVSRLSKAKKSYAS